MTQKSIVSIAAVVCALAASIGLVAVFTLSGDAGAMASARGNPPADAAALLEEMAPGAAVSTQADGSVAVSGALAPSVQAEVQRARQLADASPSAIRCDGKGATLRCTAVADSELAAALRAGEPAIYGRVIYRAITNDVTERAAPMFEAGELVCNGVRKGGTMSCSRVDRVRPSIARGETLFMTYEPLNVTFDEQGLPTFHLTGTPEIPLARAS